MNEQLSIDGAIAESDQPSFSQSVIAANPDQKPRTLDTSQFEPKQLAVYEAMKSGRWLTKREISHFSGVSEHAVSARLSELKLKWCIPNEKRRAKEGTLYEYRIAMP